MSHASRSYILALATSVAACGGGGSPAATPATAPTPASRPLATLASTGAIVTPAFTLGRMPNDAWRSRLGDGRVVLRELDSAIAQNLRARGLDHGWVFAPELMASYRRNRGYATDPYSLAEQPLLAQTFVAGVRLPEPLASQLRTMIALQESARLVLLPVDLSFWPVTGAPNDATARLKVALVDPRFSQAMWVGEVRSDTASADSRVLTNALAARVVDLIVSP